MFWVSLFTMPFGLTEPLFVPEYWSPPSLFNLAERTGFDIESLIFCFAVGGIGSVLYEVFGKVGHARMDEVEIHSRRHRFHRLALASPVIVFLPLEVFTGLNPIYAASAAMFVGGVAAILCRPDLKKKIWMGGASFLILYFVFFLSYNLVFPGIVEEVWNLEAISGILVLGVPLEELMFAFSFGMMWSSVYEHLMWYRLKEG
ncbi:MAG: hypothetical protein GXO65_07850 [Euryarchaeota archaeon]|nr:hypothetical protein [Euryarchaeota archaeon]